MKAFFSPFYYRISLFILALYQTLAYYFWLPLGMGPHVILEPWLINQGWRMYMQLPDHHTPLMPYLMALAQRILGDELRAGKLVLVGILLIILLLIYLVVRQAASEQAALLAALFFVCWSPVFNFGQLRFETFLTLFYLLAWFVWFPHHSPPKLWRAFLTGFVLGLAFLTKQHAAVFFMLFTAWQLIILWRIQVPIVRSLRLAGAAILGFLLPVAVFLIYYAFNGGSMERLIFWTLTFNDGELLRQLAYAPTGAEIQQLLPVLLLLPIFVWETGQAYKTGNTDWFSAGVPLSLLVGGTLLAIPRFGFDHLQPALPGLAVLSALCLAKFWCTARHTWRGVLIGTILIFWFAYPLSGVLADHPLDQPRYIHEYSSLPPLAGQIRQIIGPTECPYIFPEDEANSNLHFFLRCAPPGRLWLFTAYPWFSRFDLTAQASTALLQSAPRWVLYFPGRWDAENHNARLMNTINENYAKRNRFWFENSDVWLMEKK